MWSHNIPISEGGGKHLNSLPKPRFEPTSLRSSSDGHAALPVTSSNADFYACRWSVYLSCNLMQIARDTWTLYRSQHTQKGTIHCLIKWWEQASAFTRHCAGTCLYYCTQLALVRSNFLYIFLQKKTTVITCGKYGRVKSYFPASWRTCFMFTFFLTSYRKIDNKLLISILGNSPT